jgi:hypothetical protein
VWETKRDAAPVELVAGSAGSRLLQAGLIRVSGLPFTLHGTEEMLLLLAGFRAERIIA